MICKMACHFILFTNPKKFNQFCLSLPFFMHLFFSFMNAFCHRKNTKLCAVVQQFYQTRVIDEFVLRGNAAILKCNLPSFVADFVYVEAWIADDGTEILPNNNDFGTYCLQLCSTIENRKWYCVWMPISMWTSTDTIQHLLQPILLVPLIENQLEIYVSVENLFVTHISCSPKRKASSCSCTKCSSEWKNRRMNESFDFGIVFRKLCEHPLPTLSTYTHTDTQNT